MMPGGHAPARRDLRHVIADSGAARQVLFEVRALFLAGGQRRELDR
jgi:hypothetical protein